MLIVNNKRLLQVLFPWFALAMGTFAYFFLSRYVPWLPLTAVMFIIGTLIGVASVRIDTNDNVLKESVLAFWRRIDSEVLLLTFLPGLIAKDALSMDFHLFQVTFWQCFMFAFPMVLAGTALTALIGYFIFPYGWSFNFAMMFGSILSATDPVAVSALLDSLGAPPRLKVHISGESLLNDGSAIVFFTIFSELFLTELGIPGYGTDVDVARGFAIFFRMSLGAVASGLFFGLGTVVILWLLKRRLSSEENVVETATLITMAYLCYFTTDVIWGCSGVIGTLTYGLTVNVMGHSSINNQKLVDDFWAIVEHLLNTVLFTLGGLVWGGVIANDDTLDPDRVFTGTDWGYLFALYLLLTVIRFLLVFCFYPVTYSLGLRTNWQEATFESWAGLRGAVGISLGIFIDNLVIRSGAIEQSVDTKKLFGMVGGIAFLTLCINATTAAPLLRALGLAKATEIRKKIVSVARLRIRSRMIDDMVTTISLPGFAEAEVNFGVIKHHVPWIRNLKKSELAEAVKKYQKSHETHCRIDRILPYLEHDETGDDEVADIDAFFSALQLEVDKGEDDALSSSSKSIGNVSEKPDTSLTVVEARTLFLEILKGCYTRQVELGYLAGRDYLVYCLEQSLEFTTDAVSKGQPLNDWKYTSIVRNPASQLPSRWRNRKELVPGQKYNQMLFDTERCLAFIAAHRNARDILKNEFADEAEGLSSAERTALEESEEECRAAMKVLHSFSTDAVKTVVSHKVCNVLLNNAAKQVERLSETGALLETEAADFLDQIQDQLFAIEACRSLSHTGEMPPQKENSVKDEDETKNPVKASSLMASTLSV